MRGLTRDVHGEVDRCDSPAEPDGFALLASDTVRPREAQHGVHLPAAARLDLRAKSQRLGGAVEGLGGVELPDPQAHEGCRA